MFFTVWTTMSRSVLDEGFEVEAYPLVFGGFRRLDADRIGRADLLRNDRPRLALAVWRWALTTPWRRACMIPTQEVVNRNLTKTPPVIQGQFGHFVDKSSTDDDG
jgi:hypothetical protein